MSKREEMFSNSDSIHTLIKNKTLKTKYKK